MICINCNQPSGTHDPFQCPHCHGEGLDMLVRCRQGAAIMNAITAELGLGSLAIRWVGDNKQQWEPVNPHELRAIADGHLAAAGKTALQQQLDEWPGADEQAATTPLPGPNVQHCSQPRLASKYQQREPDPRSTREVLLSRPC